MRLTQYSQLKHGMRVRGVFNNRIFTDAKLSIQNNKKVYVCQNVYNGYGAEDKLGYSFSFCLCDINAETRHWSTTQLFTVEDDELVVEEGDLLVDDDDYYYRVLGVCGCVAILSCRTKNKNHSNLKSHGCDYSFYQLKREGFTIVNEEDVTIELDGKKYSKKENEDGTITLIPF